MLCPHADDGAITAACLLHEYAVRRGQPVIEVLVFAGDKRQRRLRLWLNDQKKVTVREGEFRLECNVLVRRPSCGTWKPTACRDTSRRRPNRDRGLVHQRRPGAVIVPPATDAHVAHRTPPAACRRSACSGPSSADFLSLTGWTPWGAIAAAQRLLYLRWRGRTHQGMGDPLPRVSGLAYRLYPVLLTPRASVRGASTREWAEGHSLSGRGAPNR